MRAKITRAGRRSKADESQPTRTGAARGVVVPQAVTTDSPRPLFVFNVKLFDERLLPPILTPPCHWPHRYVVVIRHRDGSVQGEGPFKSRLEADQAVTRARLAHPDGRIHLVVAPDESEEALHAFFALPDSVRLVAEEGARARDRYEEWRRRSGPARPGYVSRATRHRGALSPAFS